jgi:hypothetical protein
MIATGLTKLYVLAVLAKEEEETKSGAECIPTGGMFEGLTSLFDVIRETIGDAIFLAASIIGVLLFLIGLAKLMSTGATAFFKGAVIAATSPIWITIVLAFIHAFTVKITSMGLC